MPELLRQKYHLVFFDDIYVPVHLMPNPSHSEPDPENMKQIRWIWEFGGDNYPIDRIDEHVISEPFEPSPFMPAVTQAFDNDFNVIISRQERGQTDTDALVGLLSEKETSTRENNVAKIKVVVRKRPLNKKETARKEEDIVTVCDNAYLAVHEPKLKVYRVTVEPIIPTIFQRTKATCFAYGQTAPTVQLMFSSHLTKSKAEKYRAYILQAFESVLGSPMTIEIRCQFRKDARAGVNMPLILPGSLDGSSGNRMTLIGYNDISKRVPKERDSLTRAQLLQPDSLGLGRSEIVEINSPGEQKSDEHKDNNTQYNRRDLENPWTGEAEASHKKSAMTSLPERRKLGEQNQSQSLVRSKVSLAHVIQQAEGCTQRNGWTKRKAVSIAEKLEQENLKLEPRSRSLLCWKASRVTRRKLSRWKIRTRKPQTLLRFVSCGRCLSSKSPR